MQRVIAHHLDFKSKGPLRKLSRYNLGFHVMSRAGSYAPGHLLYLQCLGAGDTYAAQVGFGLALVAYPESNLAGLLAGSDVA